MLPLECKPTCNGADLLVQVATEKGGIQQLLADHFAKVYKVAMPLGSAA